ncbi:hypothetical protein [Acidianus ambivalens]|uniref:Uncharacterized protein n=1 Tax=Acidianus ambivalens TaxID=2283 RepID=A0A650CTD6_ACIAM|nr:hypothetical protein [Acidianus ambivalens]MQL56439.1 hypothetical protein [Acidianus ambivalens]QGR21076.1 hypothetical protein D1866_02845 [Acidianus ambivalens]
MNPDDVFQHLQEILNLADSVIISKCIEVLWAKKNGDDTSVSGYLKIGDMTVKFFAQWLDEELHVWIEDDYYHFTREEVEKVIKG